MFFVFEPVVVFAVVAVDEDADEEGVIAGASDEAEAPAEVSGDTEE